MYFSSYEDLNANKLINNLIFLFLNNFLGRNSFTLTPNKYTQTSTYVMFYNMGNIFTIMNKSIYDLFHTTIDNYCQTHETMDFGISMLQLI